MASFNFYLKDPKASDKTSLYLLFDDGVNRAKLYISESIKPKDWSAKGEAKRSLPHYADFNLKLSKIKTKAVSLHSHYTANGSFSLEEFKDQFKEFIAELNNKSKANTSGENKATKYVTDFARYFSVLVAGSRTKGTLAIYKQTINLLDEFKPKLKFEQVTLDFYEEFIAYMAKVKGYGGTTSGKHIKTLKTFLHEATERGINTNLDFKSKRFKRIADITDKIYLTEQELTQLAKTKLKTKRLEQVRDLFLLGCDTGLRFSDLSNLKRDNIRQGKIHLNTQKTGEKVVIPLTERVKTILSKYEGTVNGLPSPVSNQKMNSYLKKIGELAGLTEEHSITETRQGVRISKTVPKYTLITTHTARRSFATNLHKSGFPAIAIMKITGHRSESAFLQYIRITQEENAELLELHWSSISFLKVVTK